jgi:hypothetical protein
MAAGWHRFAAERRHVTVDGGGWRNWLRSIGGIIVRPFLLAQPSRTHSRPRGATRRSSPMSGPPRPPAAPWTPMCLNISEKTQPLMPPTAASSRSNNGAKCTREAGNAVAVARLAAARVQESSAAGTEAPRFSEGSFTNSNYRGECVAPWSCAANHARQILRT